MSQEGRLEKGLHDPLEMVVKEEKETTVGVLLLSWGRDWGLEEWRKR